MTSWACMRHAAGLPDSTGRRITTLALSRVQSWRVAEQINTMADSIVVSVSHATQAAARNERPRTGLAAERRDKRALFLIA